MMIIKNLWLDSSVLYFLALSLTFSEGRLHMLLLGTKWINTCLKIQIAFCPTIPLGFFFQNSILMGENVLLTKYSCEH